MELFKIFGTLALIGTDTVNKQLDDVTGKANNTESKFGTACKKIGTAIAGAFAADKIIQFGKDVVNTAGQSEASFAKVTTLLDTSKVNTQSYYDAVKKGANESHTSISDFSEALYQALSASVDSAHAVDFTTKAVALAKAGFTSASTAVDVMTTAINAYGLSATDADHISDNLITTQNLGKTTVDQLAQSMGRVIPTASAYGVNIDNLCASYAIMTKSGIATAESTTYLHGMLNELGKSGSTVSDIIKNKTGKSFAECMNSGMSLGDVLQILYDSVGDDTTAFANLWQSQEAGTGALSLVNAGAKEFNSTLGQMQSDAGATSSAYEKVEGTMEAKTEALKTKFSNLKSELGEKLIPVIDKVVDALSNKVIPAIEKMIPQISNVTKIAAAAATTFAAFKIGSQIQKIATAFGEAKVQIALFQMGAEGASVAQGVMNGQLTLGQATVALLTGKMTLHEAATLGVAKAQAALNAAWDANPIGIIITIIGALVAAFIYLWNTSESFRNFWKGLWDGIKTVCETVVNGIKSFLSGAWGAISSTASTVWNGISKVVTTVWNTIKNVVQVGIMAIQAILNAAFQILTLPWRFIWENFGTQITTAWNAIKTVVSTAMNTIKTVIATVWNAIKTVMSPILNGIKTVVMTVWNAIRTGTSTAFNAVRSVITGIWNGIRSVTSSVWNGIRIAVMTPVNAIRSGVSSVFNGVRSTVSGIWNGIRSVTSSVWNGIKSAITRPVEAARDAVRNAINKMKSFFHFSWSLPHLKMPHFSVSGKFSLNPPKVPSFGINWYAKAMEQPFLFTQPTLFDVNPATGQAKGAGEAGDEMMYGKSNLMEDIRTAVASQNEEVVQNVTVMFNRLFEILERYFPEFAKLKMVLDSGALVGELAPAMDEEIGNIIKKKERGLNW